VPTDGDRVSNFDTEGWGDVSRQILVALLVTICKQTKRLNQTPGLKQERECRLTVFWNEMEVIPTDDDSSVHFGGHNAASKDATTD